MPTAARRIIPGFIAIGLAACTSIGSDSQASATKPAPAPTQAGALADDKCNSAKAAQFVGQKLDDALLARVKAAVGHDTIRVIRPNQPVTMDFREDRLNLDLDANDIVTRVHCV